MVSDLIETFRGKSVLVTGHTGFKGSWLSMVLNFLGASVSGFSIDVPTEPSIFKHTGNQVFKHTFWGDIANKNDLASVVRQVKPDFIFHLAAQPLVSRSYRDPLETVLANTIGTATLLDVLRQSSSEATVVFITSDKCYENVEQIWGYREQDQLGGADVYSASKAAAEILFSAFYRSFFVKRALKAATARAGNVIGGGDWSSNRIVPDIIRSTQEGPPLELRNPESTRPWQHVLEPIVGYLQLSMFLSRGNVESGESYNFGPSQKPKSVRDLVTQMRLHMPEIVEIDSSGSPAFHEAGLLSLNCEKAFSHFGWAPILTFEETVLLTADWYKSILSGGSALEKSESQISWYLDRMDNCQNEQPL